MNAAVKRLVRERAGDACEYCGLPQSWLVPFKLQIEHILPIKHHGGDETENLALACVYCNSHKGPNISGIDPISTRLTPLFNPRQQKWSDHFEMQNGIFVGKTDIGRTTIDVLNMNTEEQVKLRKIVAGYTVRK